VIAGKGGGLGVNNTTAKSEASLLTPSKVIQKNWQKYTWQIWPTSLWLSIENK
jgi:hypothetical protein